jgi:hypothetical protein
LSKLRESDLPQRSAFGILGSVIRGK